MWRTIELDPRTHCMYSGFCATDLTLTRIVAPVHPEDESGFGAGLWTLAARLIEFTDSERERAEEEGAEGTFDRLHRPSVRQSIRSSRLVNGKEGDFYSGGVRASFLPLLQPFSLFLPSRLLMPRMIQVAMPFFPREISNSVTTLASVQGQTVIKFNKSRNSISNNRG